MARTFAKVMPWLVPPWLSAGDGGKVIAALAAVLDQLDARVRLGLLMRFPSYAHLVDGALEQIGLSRGIRRGRDETDDHYAARLRRWRYPRGHRVRGSAFALLEQISEYWGGVYCMSIDRKGNRHDFAGDTGSASYSYGNTWTWDSASATPRWARFWLVLDGTSFAAAYPTAEATDSCLGQSGVTYRDVQLMRDLVPSSGLAWKPAGTMPEWLVLMLDFGHVPLPVPDATWQYWSKVDADIQVAARSQDYRYWSLRPALNNTYGGRVENFCLAATMPDGSLYSGDAAEFPADTTLPDGSTYGGNAANFPVAVQLPDDGSRI